MEAEMLGSPTVGYILPSSFSVAGWGTCFKVAQVLLYRKNMRSKYSEYVSLWGFRPQPSYRGSPKKLARIFRLQTP